MTTKAKLKIILKTLTPTQAGAKIGVSSTSIWNWVKKDINPHKVFIDKINFLYEEIISAI